MTWLELEPLATDVATLLPAWPDIRLVAGRIDDHTARLCPEEARAVAGARGRRRHEFATGRHLARIAMAELGLPAAPVTKADDRSPVWPSGLIGSITHAAELAVAAVARQGALAGIGIDLERRGRVSERLFGKLFTDSERAVLAATQPAAECAEAATLMFSAKEAAYKAVYPSVGRFIGFQDAEMDVDWRNRTLRARYVGDHAPNRVMEHGAGHFCFFGGYVLSVFLIPR